jgi:hypothetical protein
MVAEAPAIDPNPAAIAVTSVESIVHRYWGSGTDDVAALLMFGASTSVETQVHFAVIGDDRTCFLAAALNREGWQREYAFEPSAEPVRRPRKLSGRPRRSGPTVLTFRFDRQT